VQNVELTAAGRFGAAIGEIDNLTLSHTLNGRMGILDKTFQAFRKPVVAASLLAVAIHPLLDDNPLAIVGHNETVQIKIKAILHSGAVDFGDEPARICERRPIKAPTLPDCDELPRRLPRTSSAYIFGAICPAEGKGAGLVLPSCNTEAMALHLAEISLAVAPGAHALVLLDQAGWHVSKKLPVPDNITLLPLPPKSSELNPVAFDAGPIANSFAETPRQHLAATFRDLACVLLPT
jgi:hypothetical protein